MKKRNHKRHVVKGLAVPKIVHNGIVRANREASAWAFTRPMRNVLMQLRTGEVNVIEETGEVFIDMGTVDSSRRDLPEVVPIGSALHGWIAVCEHIDPRMKTYRLRVLADRLNAGQEITEQLVEAAFSEFEDIVSALPDRSPDDWKAAAQSAEIKALLERAQEAA